ncbi:MAG: TolC family protein, partial [Armatimonadota bacterium]|nr:TolC family protein [Armatimonadota bacterium]
MAALGIVLLLHLAPPAAGQVVFTLPQAVAFALEHNPQVAANRAAVKAAEAQVRAAQAGLAPTLSLSAGGSLGGAGGSVSTSGQVSTGVTYLLYDGGVRQVQVRQAQAQLEAARQALAAALAEVALQTVQAYMAVIVAQQVVALREQAVRQARTQLQAAQANFRAGRVARADVVRAESALAASEFDEVSARGQAEISRSALRTVMGLDGGSPVTVTAPGEPPPLEVSETEAAQRALQRPEVQRAEAEVRAAEAALAIAMMQGGVTVTLDGRYVLVSTAGSGTGAAGAWSVGVGVAVPLHDGGR